MRFKAITMPGQNDGLSLIGEDLPELLAHIDRDGRYTFVNRRYEDWFGLSKRDIIGRHYREIFGEEAYVKLKPRVATVLSGQHLSFEGELPSDEDGIRWVVFSFVPDIGSGDEVQGFYALATDITERKRTQDDLQAAYDQLEEQFAARSAELSLSNVRLREEIAERLRIEEGARRQLLVFNNLYEAVIITDVAGRISDWNSGARRIFGYHKPEVLGRSPEMLYRPEDKKTLSDAIARDVRRSGRWSGELAFVRKDGAEVVCDSVVAALQDDQGALVGTVGVNRDMTQQKRTLTELQQAYQQLEFHVENSPLAVVEWDHEFRVRRWSPKAEEIFGWNVEEVRGKHPADWRFVHSEDIKTVDVVMANLLSGTQPCNVSVNRNYTKQGSVVHCEWYNSALLDASRNLVSILSLLHDITARQQADEALRRSKEELRVLTGELINAQECERRRIASELHDGIGQSLSAMKFQLENYVRSSVDDPSTVDLSTLGDVIDRIQNSVEEVRRISMDLRPPTLDDLGVLSTFKWFLREYYKVYPFIEVKTQFELQESDVPDTLKLVLYRIVQEALNNVARHAQATLVRIVLTRTHDGIHLRVEDNGQGFSLAKPILDGESRYGFGLKSMRERAKYSGGLLCLETTHGVGTTITVSWPARALG